jgi:hypothetical protein
MSRDSLVFNVSRAKNARQNVWTLQSLAFDQFVDLFSNHRPDRNKDGPAFVPGSLVGTSRKKEAVAILYFLVYDVDGKQSLAEVSEKVALTGKYAHIYTTYSHRKAKTFIKSDHYHNWATKNGLPTEHTEENVLRYLQEHDLSHLKNVVFSERMQHTADGLSIFVEHDPLDKMRIIFPLKVPFVFANNGHTSAQSIQVWKRFYHGVGNAIGLDFDVSCADPSRLYYLPSHPEGNDNYENLIVDNESEPLSFLDYHDYEKAPIEAILDRATSAHTVLSTGDAVERTGAVGGENGYIIKRQDGGDIDVADWMKRYGAGAGPALVEVLRQRVPDIFRDDGDDGKYHIECPFEELHSSSGGMGTFIAEKSQSSDWPRIHCQHAHCNGNNNEDFVAKMVTNGWLDPLSLDAIRQFVISTRNGIPADLQQYLRGQLTPRATSSAQTAAENSSSVADIVEVRDRDTILADIEKQFKAQKSLPGRLVDQLSMCNSIGDYETFWSKSAGNYNLRRDVATDVFCLALTPIGMKSLRVYYKENDERLMLRVGEIESTIANIRAYNRPLAQTVERMATERLRNTDLTRAFSKEADYYNIPFDSVVTAYAARQQNSVNEAEAEIYAAAMEFNQRHSKLVLSSDVLIVDEWRSKSEGKLVAHPVEAMKKLFSNTRFTIDYGEKRPTSMRLFDFWLDRIPNQRVYNRAVFDPACVDDPTVFNTFAGFKAYDPIPGDWGIMADHLKQIWCKGSEELFNWVVTYMAQIIQQPETRYPSAIAVIGGQGSGKSIVLEHGLIPLVRPYGVVSNNAADLSSRFNSVFDSTLIYVADESMFANDAVAMGRLKSYISSQTLQIEYKGREPEVRKMYSRFFFTTNNEHALQLDPSDRRFLMLETSLERQKDIPYFENMRVWLQGKGRNHFLHALKNWDPQSVNMQWKDLHEPPMTRIKQHQIKMSHEVPLQFFIDILLNGTITSVRGDSLELGNFEWHMDAPLVLEQRVLAAAYRDFIVAHGNRNHQKKQMTSAFSKMTGLTWEESFVRTIMPNEPGKFQFLVKLPERRKILEAQRGKIITEEQYIGSVGLNTERITNVSGSESTNADADNETLRSGNTDGSVEGASADIDRLAEHALRETGGDS